MKLVYQNHYNQALSKGEIVIYKTSKDEVELSVHFEKETVWLRQNEISLLFDKDRSVVSKHIKKIFDDQEVDKKKQCGKNAHCKFGFV